MVTPVHRFQHIDSISSQPQSSRHPRPPPYNVCREAETTRVEVDSSVYLESPSDPYRPSPVTRYRCGMWATFALATVVVAGAKFYFDHQGTGLEVLVACVVIVVLLYLVAGCTLSVCQTKEGADELVTPPQVARIEILPPPPPGSPPPPQVSDPDAPPPPYHIAVSLPHSITPPPSYEKAVG